MNKHLPAPNKLDYFSLGKKIQLKDCHCLNDDWLISLGKHHPECFTLDHCHDKNKRISEVGLKQFFQYCEGYLKVMSTLNIKFCFVFVIIASWEIFMIFHYNLM